MNLQNLIDYCRVYDLPDPLSGIVVPEPIDADRVRSAIMMRCGLLEPVYPQPDVFRQMLAQWFDNRAWNFEHLIKIIQAEYSPIENTDKYSENRTTRDGSDTITHSGSDTVRTEGKENAKDGGADQTQAGGTDTETRTPNLTRTRTDEISAENASGYQADSKHTDADTGNEITETEHGRTDTTTYGKTNEVKREEVQTTLHNRVEKKAYDGGESYTEHTHGNIGVTTNQQMITEELELIRRFNIYDWIAERVEADLFVMVY